MLDFVQIKVYIRKCGAGHLWMLLPDSTLHRNGEVENEIRIGEG